MPPLRSADSAVLHKPLPLDTSAILWRSSPVLAAETKASETLFRKPATPPLSTTTSCTALDNWPELAARTRLAATLFRTSSELLPTAFLSLTTVTACLRSPECKAPTKKAATLARTSSAWLSKPSAVLVLVPSRPSDEGALHPTVLPEEVPKPPCAHVSASPVAPAAVVELPSDVHVPPSDC